MIKGIDVNQRIEFSSVNDADEPKTIFVFRPLTAAEMMELVSDSDGNEVKLVGAKIFNFLEKCIVEVKNYPAGEIKDVLSTLPMEVITELIKEMDRINKMSRQDSKNS